MCAVCTGSNRNSSTPVTQRTVAPALSSLRPTRFTAPSTSSPGRLPTVTAWLMIVSPTSDSTSRVTSPGFFRSSANSGHLITHARSRCLMRRPLRGFSGSSTDEREVRSMSALTELRSGQPADAFVALITKTVRSVAISRNFPPPEGHKRWSSEAVSVMTAEFFTSPQTPRRLADLCLRCTTEEGLSRLLQTTIRNFLADVGRRTEVGRLVLRINDILKADPSFERDGDCWKLTGMTNASVAVDLDDLVAVASKIRVNAPTAWRKSSYRKSPDIDKSSVIRLAKALLMHARGPLRPSVIAQVVARRLGIGQTPLTVDATAFDSFQNASVGHDTTADETIAIMRADEVFELLNDSERAAVGLAGLSAAALGEVMLVSKSTAALIRSRAIVAIRAELQDEEYGQEIATIVLNKAREWATTWVADHDAP